MKRPFVVADLVRRTLFKELVPQGAYVVAEIFRMTRDKDSIEKVEAHEENVEPFELRDFGKPLEGSDLGPLELMQLAKVKKELGGAIEILEVFLSAALQQEHRQDRQEREEERDQGHADKAMVRLMKSISDRVENRSGPVCK